MSEFTKGPWFVDPKRKLRIVTAQDITVASCGTSDSIRDHWEGNARLISAAPELLLVAQYVRDNCDMDTTLQTLVDKAIAKAESI